MECQQQSLVRQCVFGVHPKHFAGREEHHCGIREVIIPASAAVAVVRAVLDQQNGVKLELYEILFKIGILQVDEACLRMQGLASEAAVAFAHVFYV